MASPKFNIGSKVYLIESASHGFLEVYTITSITSNGSSWAYKMSLAVASPSNVTVGDRNTLTSSFDLVFYESDLCTLCEAIAKAKSYHTAQLNKLNDLELTHCS